MADNVLTMKKDKKESAEQKVENFVMRNRGVILGIGALLILVAIGFGVFFGVSDSVKNKKLSAIDAVETAYTKDSDSLTDAQIVDRQNEALEALKAYVSEKGIVGVRANSLVADIYMSKKDFANAIGSYVAAAEASPNAYTAGLAYANAAVCCDELGNSAEAISYYEKAIEKKNFSLVTRSMFNLGRLHESMGHYETASEVYGRLILEHAGDTWANLAQTRLIVLENEGKIKN